MQENTIVVKPVSGLVTVRHLLSGAKEHGGLVDQLCDIYGLAIVMADYEVRLDAASRESDAETILSDLAHAEYVSTKGEKIVKDKVIAVHVTDQQKHLLVRIMEDGDTHVFYHTKPRDEDGAAFVLEMVKPMRNLLGDKVGVLDQRTVFKATDYNDVISAITELRLGKFANLKGAVKIGADNALTIVDKLVQKEKLYEDYEGDTLNATLLPLGERNPSLTTKTKTQPDSFVNAEVIKAADDLTGGKFSAYFGNPPVVPKRKDQDDVPPYLRVD